jgi:hypothetical protein
MAEPATSDERQVLDSLISLSPNAVYTDKTVEAVAERTGLSEERVRDALRKLDDRDPPVIDREVDDKLGIEFWVALDEGAEQEG